MLPKNKCNNTQKIYIDYYNTQWGIINLTKREANKLGKKSFEKLVPYLQEFSKLNPGSMAIHECDNANQLMRVFVCPGTYC